MSKNETRPSFCVPISQYDVSWGSRFCRNVPAPKTRPFAICLGTVVLGLGVAGAISAAARIRRRRRWLDRWLSYVDGGEIRGWALRPETAVSNGAEETPWLARAGGEETGASVLQLTYQPSPGSESTAAYRQIPVGPIVVARIEPTTEANAIERGRRGERGARKLILAVLISSAALLVPQVIYFFATNRRF